MTLPSTSTDEVCAKPQSSLLQHTWRPDGEVHDVSRGLTAYYFECLCGKRKEKVRYSPIMKRHGAVDSEKIY